MGLSTLTLVGILIAPGQAPTDVMPFNQAKMEIPIRYDPSQKQEIRDLLLFVAPDGKGWQQYAVANPERDTFFTFTAPSDGVYWFNMVTVTKDGRRDPADVSKVNPPLKVLIDTRPPAIQIKNVERSGDDVTLHWEVQELHPDWSKFRVEYRIDNGLWNTVDAKPAAMGSAKIRANAPGPMTIRIQASDTAGNRGEQTKELAQVSNVLPTRDNALQRTSASVGGPGDIAPPTMQDPSKGGFVLPPENKDPRGENITPGGSGVLQPSDPPAPPARSELATGGAATAPANLPAAQVINVSRFDLSYEVENKGPSGISRAEVWVTRDEGKNWQRWDISEKGESPITVDLTKRGNAQVEGMYGLKIVLQSGAGLSKGPPVGGEVPEMRVDVDLTPPVVKVYEPIPDPNQKDTMILRWQATDRNLAAEPITLEWGEAADGPWHPITGDDGKPAVGTTNSTTKRIANTGQYAWKLAQNFPAHRVYLRVTARDTAGNLAEHKTLHPILVDLNKPTARIQGIIGAPSDRR